MVQLRPKANHENVYMHFVNICVESGVPDIIASLDRMIVLDYIIANEDRHMNNFGLLRNAQTLEWIGFAPIFDSGTSLGYNTATQNLLVYEPICKPFKKSHHEQLSLVSDYSWIDFASLDGIEDEIHELLLGENVEKYIDEQRRNAIITGLSERIENLKKIAKTHWQKNFNSLENDVLEDIATEYSGETEL